MVRAGLLASGCVLSAQVRDADWIVINCIIVILHVQAS